jgi:hypothetical protein
VTNTTTFAYEIAGGQSQLKSAQINDGRARSVTYSNDLNGQVMRRDESDRNTSAGDPHEIWYRFGGKEMGYVGNNGTTDVDYAASIAQRTAAAPTGTQGAFRNGATTGASYSDFDQSYNPINSYEQGYILVGLHLRRPCGGLHGPKGRHPPRHCSGPLWRQLQPFGPSSTGIDPPDQFLRYRAPSPKGTKSPKSAASQGKVGSLWWDGK